MLKYQEKFGSLTGVRCRTLFLVIAYLHINTVVNCLICNVDPKDLKHMLFCCDKVAEVWRQLGL
jgi:hypothetical protein